MSVCDCVCASVPRRVLWSLLPPLHAPPPTHLPLPRSRHPLRPHKTLLARLHSFLAKQRTGHVEHRKRDFCQKESVSRGGVLGFLLRQRETKTGAVVGTTGETFSFRRRLLLCAVTLSPPPHPVERTFCQCHDCCVLFFSLSL